MSDRIKSPDFAKQFWPCPLAKAFKGPGHVDGLCCGDACPVWRWEPIPATVMAPHIRKRTKDANEDSKTATAWVYENREKLGIPVAPVEGYCGLGGRPLA